MLPKDLFLTNVFYLLSRSTLSHLSHGKLSEKKTRNYPFASVGQFHFAYLLPIANHVGRYIILIGSIEDVAVTIVSYYVLNTQQIYFLLELFILIDTYWVGTVIMWDSNSVLNPHMDRHSSSLLTLQSLPQILHF